MLKTTKWLIGGAAALAMGATGLAVAHAEDNERGERSEREEAVQIGDLPGPVRQTVQQQFQGGAAQRIEKRTDHGRTVYEVYSGIDGKPMELFIGEDGRILGSGASTDQDDDD